MLESKTQCAINATLLLEKFSVPQHSEEKRISLIIAGEIHTQSFILARAVCQWLLRFLAPQILWPHKRNCKVHITGQATSRLLSR